jgi:hypothetical protein
MAFSLSVLSLRTRRSARGALFDLSLECRRAPVQNDSSGSGQPFAHGDVVTHASRAEVARGCGPVLNGKKVLAQEHAMQPHYMVGIKTANKSTSVSVEAEDALIAALKVKHENPTATITYVRKCNARGDRRHPHRDVARKAD